MTQRGGTVTPVAYSHASIPDKGSSLLDAKLHRMNASTTRSRACAWPSCTSALTGDRVGILCRPHADEVADAVLEDRVINRYFEVHAEAERMDRIKQSQSAEERDLRRWEQQRARDAAFLRGQPGYVYYLLVGDRIKVGFSADVRQRLRSYPPGSELLAVEPGTLATESERHRQFRQYLVAGREWFRRADEIDQHMAAVLAEHGDARRFAR